VGPRRRQLLEIYLNGHWAGASAGVSLAERVAYNNTSSVWFEQLRWMADDVAADAATLAKVRARVGIRRGRAKRVAVRIGERLTRTKPGRRFFAASPLSRVLEAEAMIAGVSAKRQLWVSLGEESLYFGDDADFDFDDLARRADGQLEVLRGFHQDAAAIAFGATEPSLGVGT
jgi:hypothetical protein